MNNKIVYLYWDNIKIGRLTYVDNKYWYQIIEEGLKKVKNNSCPVELIQNPITKQSKTISKKIPFIFEEFIISRNRNDLIKELKISILDSEFEILYKVAKNSQLFSKNGFWISNK